MNLENSANVMTEEEFLAYNEYLREFAYRNHNAKEISFRIRSFSWFVLSKMWWVMAIVAIMTGIAGSVFAFFIAPQVYQSSCNLLIVKNNMVSFATEHDFSAAENALKDCVALVKSDKILYETIETLGYKELYDVTDLQKKIKAKFQNKTHIITITVRSESPKEAADIANAVADSFKIFLDDMLIPDTQSEQFCTRVDTAIMSTTPVSPDIFIIILISLIAGNLLGFIIIFLFTFLDEKIKAPEQIIFFTGTNIIAYMPVFDEDKNH